MKSTILLTIALFLISAPSPDSQTISEMSAGFLLAPENPGLMAAANPAKSFSDVSEKTLKVETSQQKTAKTNQTEENL